MTWSMRLNGGDLTVDGEPVRHETSLGAFTVTVVKDGTGFGNREPLTKTMNTLMTQGSWEVVERFGNRAPALVIEVEGETADGLNAGEVWLSELMAPGALEWLPPRQTVWTVFDVVTCHIDRTEDGDWDLDEDRWIRVYRVPIRALPHARSNALTITEAETTAGTDILVDGGTSTAGWSAELTVTDPTGVAGPTTDPGVSLDGGRIEVAFDPGSESGIAVLLRVRRSGTVDLSGARIVRVDCESINGVPKLRLGAGPIVTSYLNDYSALPGIRSYYRIPAGMTSTPFLELEWDNYAVDPGPQAVFVDQVRLSDGVAVSATGRQKIQALTPGGSAPAEGSLEVYTPNDTPLGLTVVHSYPLGRPSPALMQYRTASGEEFGNESGINPVRYTLHDADLVLTIPEPQIPTRGLATLWAKLRNTSAAAKVTWTVKAMMGSTTVGVVQTGVVDVPDKGTDWQMIPLGLVSLPPAETGPDGKMVVTLRQTTGTGALADEVWAFGQDDESGLTIHDSGTLTHSYIDAPSPTSPAGKLLIGNSRATTRTPSSIPSPQIIHRLPATGVSVLFASFANPPLMRLTHYRRWTHHAGT